MSVIAETPAGTETPAAPAAAGPRPEAEAAEAFAGRMVGVLNEASLALLASIGHQVGLFDTLASLPPATSAQVAAAARLQERYVREWLGGMVTAGVVDYDPATATYRLPPAHAGFLTRAAGPDNLAATTQFITLLAGVEAQVVECFRSGGGVPYSAYEEFHRLMAEDSGAVHDAVLVEHILPLVPGLADRLAAGAEAADVGCGSGHAVNLLAAAFPASRFVGYDIAEEGVAAGRREAQALGLTNATFEVRDAADLGEVGRFDLVTAFDAIHDQAHPDRVLAGIARSLRPGGVFLMVDVRADSDLAANVGHLFGPFLYALSTMHCMTVSLSQGGAGLGTAWGEQRARAMLADAGFTEVEVTQVEGDVFNSYFIARRG